MSTGRAEMPSLQRIQGERDGLVGSQRSPLLPHLGKRSFVELRADRADRLLVHPLHPSGMGAGLLEQSLPARENAGGCSRSSRGGEGAGEAADDVRPPIDIAGLTIRAI